MPTSSAHASASRLSAGVPRMRRPPVGPHPKPISETVNPVRPNLRSFTGTPDDAAALPGRSGLEGWTAQLLADRREQLRTWTMSERHRTVDDEDRACDHGGERGAQKGRCPRELIGPPQAQRGRVASARVADIGGVYVFGQILVRKEARDESIHSDPVRRPF